MSHWEQTYQLAADGGLQVEQRSGRLKVTGWDQPLVKVMARSSDPESIADRLTVEASARSLHIRVERKHGGFFGFLNNQSSIDLEIMVPQGVRCNLLNGSGPIEVTGTQGPLTAETGSGPVTAVETRGAELHTGSGSVFARHISGNLTLQTGSGNVVVEAVGGSVEAETGSGSVVVRRIGGALKVETGSGTVSVEDVEGSAVMGTGSGSVQVRRVRGPFLEAETGGGTVILEQIDVNRLEAETGSGSVKLELVAVQPQGQYRIETGSGTVTVAIPPLADITLDLEVGSGRIRHRDLPLRVTRSEPDQLQAVLNQGSAKLQVRGGGGILIEPYLAPAVAPASPVLKMVAGDAALETSGEIKRILEMVREGKLTPEEADEILGALDDEEARV